MLTLLKTVCPPVVFGVLVLSFTVVSITNAQNSQTREEQYIDGLFQRHDANKDGKLSIKEIGKMRRPLKPTERQIKQGFVTPPQALLLLFQSSKQAVEDPTKDNRRRISGSDSVVEQSLGQKPTSKPRKSYRVKANVLVFEDLSVEEKMEVISKLAEFSNDELGLVLDTNFKDRNPIQDAYSLSTYLRKKSTFTTGKTIPIVTGAVTRNGTKQLSYEYQPVGTIASLDVVKNSDGLAVSLTFEKSYLQETEEPKDNTESIRPKLRQEIKISTECACVLDGRTVDVINSGDKVIFFVVAIELEK